MSTKKLIALPSPGDLVFARVTGHPVWPARVQARQGEFFSVFFYGTFDLATVKAGAIYPYNEQNKAKFANHPAVIKKKVFSQAIEQIEETPEIAPVLDNNKNAIVVVKKPIKKVIQPKTSSINEKADIKIGDMNVEEKIEIPQDSKKEIFSPGKKVFAKGILSTSSFKEKSDHAKATAQTSTKSVKVIKSRKISQEVVTKSTIEAKSNGQNKRIKICSQDTNFLNTSHSLKENIVNEADNLKVRENSEKLKKDCEKNIQLKNNQPEKATVKTLPEKLAESEVSLREKVGVLDKKVLLKPKEGDDRHKAALMERLKKIAWLKTEQQVVDIDRGIKSSLSKSNPRISCCLDHLDALLVLPLQPLMLLKRPDLVDTLMKLQKYVGPADLAKYSSEDKGKIIKGVKKIQKLLAAAFIKLSKLFPEISTSGKKDFLVGFKVQVKKLEESTTDWPEDKVLCMTELPDDQCTTGAT